MPDVAITVIAIAFTAYTVGSLWVAWFSPRPLTLAYLAQFVLEVFLWPIALALIGARRLLARHRRRRDWPRCIARERGAR